MRIGLGCMRLSTEHERDDARARETLHAALDAGITLLDTAHAYGLDQADAGHNERLVGRVVGEHGPGKNATHAAAEDAIGAGRAPGLGRRVRVVTKCGMRRDGGAWIPDGRGGRIAADVEASLAALDGVSRAPRATTSSGRRMRTAPGCAASSSIRPLTKRRSTSWRACSAASAASSRPRSVSTSAASRNALAIVSLNAHCPTTCKTCRMRSLAPAWRGIESTSRGGCASGSPA